MSNEYVIYTDSSADLNPQTYKEWGLECSSLTFRFNGEDKEYKNDDMDIVSFYDKMKAGGVAKTSAVNSEAFKAGFAKILESGKDVLYLGFSSGLSTTTNSARLAQLELAEIYPDRKIIIVDTLCASAGVALLVNMVIEKKNAGASIEEAAAFAESNKKNICHWFTVDDLVYLKRGGRVSSTTAFVGNVLGIKPVMHVDDDGHLINVSKARGRKNSIMALADKYGTLRIDDTSKVFISHGNCINDAKELANIIESKYGKKVDLITDVGPVIGAHSGPGTLALFFVGKER